ncbi:MAG: sigma-70 family RNA polymerase sigma factor [Candidatus Blackburnbacteria bacterium]|nr:sigma-70 family RNA polymerase sigma factor [Candidatus Blackburnbacteria bacterium]
MTIELSPNTVQTETMAPLSFCDKYTPIVEQYPRLRLHFDSIKKYQQVWAKNLTDEEMEVLLVSCLWTENPMLVLRLSSVLKLDKRTINEYVDRAAYDLQRHSDQLVEFERSKLKQAGQAQPAFPNSQPATVETVSTDQKKDQAAGIDIKDSIKSAHKQGMLSVRWFKKNNLLDVLFARFGGDIEQARRYALGEEPEATTVSVKKPSSNGSIATPRHEAGGLEERLHNHPLLSIQQERLAFEYLQRGALPTLLLQNEEFQKEIQPQDLEQFEEIFAQSKNIVEVICYFNYRLVDSVAKQWGGLPQDDKIQEGYMGLLKAIQRFDPTRGNKFSTVAVWWIRSAITRAILDSGHEIRIPGHLGEQVGKLREIYSNFQSVFGRTPTAGELRRYLAASGLPNTTINGLIRASVSGVLSIVSMHQKVGPQGDIELLHFIKDEKADLSASVEQKEELGRQREKRVAILKTLRSTLSEREMKVILNRFGFAGQVFTLEEIGQGEGLTRERVRQIEAGALQKLRGIRDLKEQWWEQDPPSFVYRMSAQEAALRLGLAEKGKVSSFAWGQVIAYKAVNDEKVWASLSERDRAMLAYYLHPNRGLNVVLERLGEVFSKSKNQISAYLTEAVDNAAALLVKKRTYEHIKAMINGGYSDKQIRQQLHMSQEKADRLIHYFRVIDPAQPTIG